MLRFENRIRPRCFLRVRMHSRGDPQTNVASNKRGGAERSKIKAKPLPKRSWFHGCKPAVCGIDKNNKRHVVSCSVHLKGRLVASLATVDYLMQGAAVRTRRRVCTAPHKKQGGEKNAMVSNRSVRRVLRHVVQILHRHTLTQRPLHTLLGELVRLSRMHTQRSNSGSPQFTKPTHAEC